MTVRPGPFLILLIALSPLRAQAPDADRLQVRCLAADGEPVAGADVWVWQYRSLPDDSGDRIAAGPFVSDANGMASTVVQTTFKGDRFDRWVYARVAGRLVGAARSVDFDGSHPDATITVELRPSRSIHGRVTAPEESIPRPSPCAR